LLAAASAQAAPLPGAGQLLQQIQPAPPPPAAPASPLPDTGGAGAISGGGGATVTVREFHISGATVFSAATLEALLADACGKAFDLAGLRALAQRITDYYRARGYLLARA
jgi:hemolysin activation/secretion protein